GRLDVVRYPLSVIRCPLSVIGCPLSVIGCPLVRVSVSREPTDNGQRKTNNGQRTRSALEVIPPQRRTDHHVELGVELLAAEALRFAMLRVLLPGQRGGGGLELDDRDAFAVGAGIGPDALKSGHLLRQFNHAFRPPPVLRPGFWPQSRAKDRHHRLGHGTSRRPRLLAPRAARGEAAAPVALPRTSGAAP